MTLRTADLVVIGIGLAVIAGIGVVCSRRSRTADGYFLAGRSVPGWAVGFSLMATIVSSMTFLALPAAAYQANWRHLPANAMYLLAIPVAWCLFIPFYRAGGLQSAYEYLERRFGAWARWYAGGAFMLFHLARMGLILFVASKSIQVMIGREEEEWVLDVIMVVFGVVVAGYTILGGLRAVIWTDVLQGVALIGGGLICLPILLNGIPGGFGGLLEIAHSENKMSFGIWPGDESSHTLGATMLTKLVVFLQVVGTDQTTVQRYCAAGSDREARRALMIGGLLTVPVWGYFLFVGTALFAFYHNDPSIVAGLAHVQIFPHFIMHHVPAGLAGFVIIGLIAAAMSTLDSSINAIASTVTNDFYRRLWRRDANEEHYGNFGRLMSLVVGCVMVFSGLVIHVSRTAEGVEDLQTKLLSILGGGILGLFLLGLLTRRATSRSAAIATALTLGVIISWVGLATETAGEWFPTLHAWVQDTFWVGVVSNPLLFGLGWLLGRLSKTDQRSLARLTIWTRESESE